MREWLTQHWDFGIIAGLTSIVGWFIKRDIRRVEAAQNDHDARLRALESQHVTHNDIAELRASLTATMAIGLERVETSVRDLTRHLLEKK